MLIYFKFNLLHLCNKSNYLYRFFFWYLLITSLGRRIILNYNCQWGGIIRILRRGGGFQVNFYCDTCTIKIFRWKCNSLFHFVKGLFRWTIFQSYTKNHIALLSSSFHNTKYFRFNKSNANRGSFTLLKIQLSCHDVKFYSAFWTLELNLLCIFLTVS